MRRRIALCFALFAGCAMPRGAFATRRLQIAGSLRSGDGEGSVARDVLGAGRRLAPSDEVDVASDSRWDWPQLYQRIGLEGTLRDLLMRFLPLTYYWIASKIVVAKAVHVVVWEVASSVHGVVSDRLRIVGEFAPCADVPVASRSSWSPDIKFAGFLPRQEHMFIACTAESVNVFFLETWHVPSGLLTHRFEEYFFHDPLLSRPLSPEHMFSRNSPPREYFLGVTKGPHLSLWDTTSWNMLWRQRRATPFTTAFSPGGDMLAVVEYEPYFTDTITEEKKVAILDVATGRELCGAMLADTRLAARGSAHRLGFTGEWLTVCDPEGGESLNYRVLFGDDGCRLQLDYTRVMYPCADASGSGLILSGRASRVWVGSMWQHAREFHFLATLKTYQIPDGLPGASFAPDGRSALFRVARQWFLWPFADGRRPQPVAVDRAVFSDDGTLLVGFGDARLVLVQVASEAMRRVTAGPGAELLLPRSVKELLAVGGARGWGFSAQE